MSARGSSLMVAVDLMPSEVRMSQAYRGKLRSWTMITAWTVATAAVPVTLEWVNQGRLRQVTLENARLLDEHSATRSKLNQVVAKRQTFGRQMACADALRSKRAWSGIMTLFQRSMPQEVWLQSMASRDPLSAAAGTKAAAKPDTGAAPSTINLEGPRKMELEGFALEHDHIYEFMSSLREWDAFNKVELTRSGKEIHGETTAVRFKVECLW